MYVIKIESPEERTSDTSENQAKKYQVNYKLCVRLLQLHSY